MSTFAAALLGVFALIAICILCIFANAYRKARDNALHDEAYGDISHLPSFKHDGSFKP